MENVNRLICAHEHTENMCPSSLEQEVADHHNITVVKAAEQLQKFWWDVFLSVFMGKK